MEIFDIGPMEFLLILIITLVILGPDQMISTAQKIGEGIRKIIKSPIWTSLMDSSREIQNLKTQIVKETGLDETMKEIRQATSQIPTVTFDPKSTLGVDLNLPKLNDIKNSPDPDSSAASTPLVVDAIVKPVVEPDPPNRSARDEMLQTPVNSGGGNQESGSSEPVKSSTAESPQSDLPPTTTD